MLKIRSEQTAALRKHALADGLIDTFAGSKLTAGRDPATGDVLATDPRGNSTRFRFDQYGFIGGVVSPTGRKWSLENNADGKLRRLTNPAGIGLGIQRN